MKNNNHRTTSLLGVIALIDIIIVFISSKISIKAISNILKLGVFMNYPDKDEIYFQLKYKEMLFLKNIISNPNIIIGDYTYYHSFDDPLTFEKNILYNFANDKLIIGKFCAIAHGVRFIMNGASHKIEGFSSFPFAIFHDSWSEKIPLTSYPNKGNITIGNDVWLGMESTIMPGVTIGDGAIIAAQALVTKDVLPYTIVGGNPAKIIRKRFDQKIIDKLLKLKWWDWDIQKITDKIPFLYNYDEEKLQQLLDLENK